MWKLNKDKCTSCGECINDCPIDALEMHEGFPRIKEKGECIGCGMCVSLCPEGALVAPKKAQEIPFTDGQASVALVPSSDLDGAKHRIRVVTTSIEGNYKSKTAIIDEMGESPDTDCTLHGLLAASSSEEEEQPGSGTE